MACLSNLLKSMRRLPAPDPLRPVSPIVSPDPETAAALERKREALAYTPMNSFHRDIVQRRRPVRPTVITIGPLNIDVKGIVRDWLEQMKGARQ